MGLLIYLHLRPLNRLVIIGFSRMAFRRRLIRHYSNPFHYQVVISERLFCVGPVLGKIRRYAYGQDASVPRPVGGGFESVQHLSRHVCRRRFSDSSPQPCEYPLHELSPCRRCTRNSDSVRPDQTSFSLMDLSININFIRGCGKIKLYQQDPCSWQCCAGALGALGYQAKSSSIREVPLCLPNLIRTTTLPPA